MGRERIVRNVHGAGVPRFASLNFHSASQRNSRQSDRVDRRFITLNADAEEVAVGVERIAPDTRPF